MTDFYNRAMLLEGLHLPLTTPFYRDGRLYLKKLEHNVARYSRTPVSGLAVLTRVGEASLLSDEETREAMRVVSETAAPEKVLMVDVSRDSVMATMALAETAASLSYDAVLLGVPPLLRSSGPEHRVESLITYFATVADRCPLPIVLVSGSGDRSGNQGPALSAEMIGQLADRTSVIGIVDDALDEERLRSIRASTAAKKIEAPATQVFAPVTARMLRGRPSSESGNYIGAETLSSGGMALATAPPVPALRTRSKTVAFQIFAGSIGDLLSGWRAGADGAMVPFAACAPQATYEVWAAWKDGNVPLAEEKQRRLLEAAGWLEDRIPALKFACDLNGYFGGSARLPLLPLTGEERLEVERMMRPMRS